MAEWRRRSIAGGPLPETPSEDSPGDLLLDFFYRPSAAHVSFPCDGAGGRRALEAAIRPTPRLTKAITDEASLLPAADGDSRTAVAPPLQPRQCPPVGTAATGGGGSRRRRSCCRPGTAGVVSRPSSSQRPSLPEHVAASFVNNEAGDEEGEDAILYAHNDEHEQARWPGRSEEDDEALRSGRGEEADEALSPGHGEEDEVTSAWRNYNDEEQDGEEVFSENEEEEEEQEEEEEEEEWEEEEEEEEEDEEEEEEEEEVYYCRARGCGSEEYMVMLIPCRHVCYCRTCFDDFGQRSPAGKICPVCHLKYERGHNLFGGLGPRR